MKLPLFPQNHYGIKHGYYLTNIILLWLLLILCPTKILSAATLEQQLLQIHQNNIAYKDHYWKTIATTQQIYDTQEQIAVSTRDIKKQINNLNILIKQLKNGPVTGHDAAFYSSISQKRSDLLKKLSNYYILNYQLNQELIISKKNNHVSSLLNLTTKDPSIFTLSIHKIKSELPTYFSYIQHKLIKNSILEYKNIIFIVLILSSIVYLAINFLLIKLNTAKKIITLLSHVKIHLFVIIYILIMKLFLATFLTHANIPSVSFALNITFLYTVFMAILTIDLTLNKKYRYCKDIINSFCFWLVVTFFGYNYLIVYYLFSLTHLPLYVIDLRLVVILCILIFGCVVMLQRDRSLPTEPIIVNLIKRVRIIASIILTIYLSTFLLDSHTISPELLSARNLLYILILNATYLWGGGLIFKTDYFTKKSSLIQNTAKALFSGVFLAIIICGLIGYHHFSLLIITDIIITIMITILVIYLFSWVINVNRQINHSNTYFSKKIHTILGVDNNKIIIEISVFIVVCMIGIIIYSVIPLLQMWGMVLSKSEDILLAVSHGFVIFDTRIYPVRIIRSCMIFSIILLAGRFLATFIINHQTFSEDKDIHKMIRSIILSITIAIAIMFGLIIAGIDPNSIFLVCGGLSFGIGFGFKQFISDASSGLYITIDKPLKIGDRIAFGDIEGVVKKIGLLSTQITTHEQSDVIIPNSNLVTNTLINYTFLSNTLHRIQIIVIIDNNQDIEAAEKLLLEVAQNNNKVIQSNPYQPNVLLKSNHLILECVIQEIKNKNIIVSELSFAITQIFNEHKIPMQLV